MNLYLASIFGLGVLLALDPIISQAVGAGDPEAIARGVQKRRRSSLSDSGS